MSDEIFLPVPGYEGKYEVSNMGRVKSFFEGAGRKRTVGFAGKILKETYAGAGYPTVQLTNNGQKVKHYIHALVLSAFVGPRPQGMVCCHNNSNKEDNRLINLRYDTVWGNADAAVKLGSVKGQKNGVAKLTDEDVLSIRRLRAQGASLKVLANAYGVTESTVSEIVRHLRWSHIEEDRILMIENG